jgi:hypothetical protein
VPAEEEEKKHMEEAMRKEVIFRNQIETRIDLNA